LYTTFAAARTDQLKNRMAVMALDNPDLLGGSGGLRKNHCPASRLNMSDAVHFHLV
jgi:hypothetical protein